MDQISLQRARVFAAVVAMLPVPPAPECARVAVDGVDGVGKTTLAAELAALLRARGRAVVQVSADDFLHCRAVRHRRGRDSPAGFWLDSYADVVIDHSDVTRPGSSTRRRHRRAGFAAGQRLPRPEQPAPCRADGVQWVPMRANRSMPAATVIPVLTYPDVREAVAWLSAAFGLVERVRIGEHHRAQLQLGDGALIVADVHGDRRPPRPGELAHSVLVRVEDARAHCEQARAHGARILMEPTDFEYGERQYKAEDPAGHQWTFSETLADVAPEEWGGESVNAD